MSENGRHSDAIVTRDSLPGLARVAVTSLWRTGNWAAQTYVNAGRRIVDVALHPEKAMDLAEDLRDAAGAITRSLVGEEVDERVRTAAGAAESRVRSAARQNPVSQAVVDVVPPVTREHRAAATTASEPRAAVVAPAALHDQGAELLRKSSDVRYEEPAHPAYARIVGDLAPDEGRILRLLMKSGPQPSVDVRTGGPIGLFTSHLIAPGLNMIGARAGCRYVERVPSYLNNLNRLGLVWFSRETLRDPHEYQVVEAQPDVLAAMHKVRAAKIVRRSIHLTPFGEDFCRDALAIHTGEFAAVPAHSHPPEDPSKESSPPAER